MLLDVAGCPIHVREAGTQGPPLVLVHGGSGHSHWWDDVLAHLGDRRTLAMDLSGHGDSGRRDEYLPQLWADEIGTVARHAGSGARVVGHSMGGRMGALAAARHPDAIEALVVVDSALPLHPREHLPRVRPRREYPDRETALSRFHLLPREPEDAEQIARLAADSITQDGDVWTFKWDPLVYAHLLDQAPEDALGDVRCPVLVITGEHSVITSAAMTDDLRARLGRDAPAIEVAGAHHHVPLSHPAELAALLETEL